MKRYFLFFFTFVLGFLILFLTPSAVEAIQCATPQDFTTYTCDYNNFTQLWSCGSHTISAQCVIYGATCEANIAIDYCNLSADRKSCTLTTSYGPHLCTYYPDPTPTSPPGPTLTSTPTPTGPPPPPPPQDCPYWCATSSQCSEAGGTVYPEYYCPGTDVCCKAGGNGGSACDPWGSQRCAPACSDDYRCWDVCNCFYCGTSSDPHGAMGLRYLGVFSYLTGCNLGWYNCGTIQKNVGESVIFGYEWWQDIYKQAGIESAKYYVRKQGDPWPSFPNGTSTATSHSFTHTFNSPGKYDVLLLLQKNWFCWSSQPHTCPWDSCVDQGLVPPMNTTTDIARVFTVDVKAAPKCEFTQVPSTVEVGKSYTIKVKATGDNQNIRWITVNRAQQNCNYNPSTCPYGWRPDNQRIINAACDSQTCEREGTWMVTSSDMTGYNNNKWWFACNAYYNQDITIPGAGIRCTGNPWGVGSDWSDCWPPYPGDQPGLDADAYTDKDSKEVQVFPSPTPVPVFCNSISGDSPVFAETTHTYTASVSGPVESYEWSASIGSPSTATTTNFSWTAPSMSGTADINLRVFNAGKTRWADCPTKKVQVFPPPPTVKTLTPADGWVTDGTSSSGIKQLTATFTLPDGINSLSQAGLVFSDLDNSRAGVAAMLERDASGNLRFKLYYNNETVKTGSLSGTCLASDLSQSEVSLLKGSGNTCYSISGQDLTISFKFWFRDGFDFVANAPGRKMTSYLFIKDRYDQWQSNLTSKTWNIPPSGGSSYKLVEKGKLGVDLVAPTITKNEGNLTITTEDSGSGVKRVRLDYTGSCADQDSTLNPPVASWTLALNDNCETVFIEIWDDAGNYLSDNFVLWKPNWFQVAGGGLYSGSNLDVGYLPTGEYLIKDNGNIKAGVAWINGSISGISVDQLKVAPAWHLSSSAGEFWFADKSFAGLVQKKANYSLTDNEVTGNLVPPSGARIIYKEGDLTINADQTGGGTLLIFVKNGTIAINGADNGSANNTVKGIYLTTGQLNFPDRSGRDGTLTLQGIAGANIDRSGAEKVLITRYLNQDNKDTPAVKFQYDPAMVFALYDSLWSEEVSIREVLP